MKLSTARNISAIGWVGAVLLPFIIACGYSYTMGGSGIPFMVLIMIATITTMVGIIFNHVVDVKSKQIMGET